MLRQAFHTITALFLGICFTAACAQSEPVTLDQCLEWGAIHNHSIRQLALDKEINEPARWAAVGRFLPQLSAGYGIYQSNSRISTYVADDGRVIQLPITIGGETIPVENRESRNSRYFLNIDEVLFDGGQNYFDFQNAKIAEKLRDAEFSGETLRLRAEITRAYCIAVAAAERMELAEEILIQRRRQLDFANVRFNTGTVTRPNVLQAEVDLGRAENDSLTAVFQQRQSIENLNLLTGIPIDST